MKGKSQQGYLWVYSRPRGDVIFEWRLSRSREGPEEFLKNFKGRLQTDGYYAYESLAKERKGELTLVACWAHCRRGFHEALAETRLAAWFVRQIGLLYAVEKHLREKKAGPRLRAAMRNWQTDRSWNDWAGRWSWCVVALCRKDCWERLLTMRSSAGKR